MLHLLFKIILVRRITWVVYGKKSDYHLEYGLINKTSLQNRGQLLI